MKLTLLFLLAALPLNAQDTISFFSKAFGEERTIVVHKPYDLQYSSKEVVFPVVYLLDGQHDWFTMPFFQTLENLEYTKEIPGAFVIEIPHENRVKECNIKHVDSLLPLQQFLTAELEKQLRKYPLNGFRLLVGHSFSASFALYSYAFKPGYFDAVFAHTPNDELEQLILKLEKLSVAAQNKIFLSIGGKVEGKDNYHRAFYEQLKAGHPDFFEKTERCEADFSSHNAVPIACSPAFLSNLFQDYRGRYNEIAQVDANYVIIAKPGSVADEMQQVKARENYQGHDFPISITDLNGIASRFYNNDYLEHAEAV